MRNKLFVLTALAAQFLASCAEGDIDAADLIACGVFDASTHICDERDGKTYKIVRMPDARFWMAENLNYEPPHGSSMCYRDKKENCDTYGRLYSSDEIGTICPKGWKVPDDDEWLALEDKIIDENDLKARQGWHPSKTGADGNGDDEYGFAILPAGAYNVRYVGVDISTVPEKDNPEGKNICDLESDNNDGTFPPYGGNNDDNAEALGKIAVLMSGSIKYPRIYSNEAELKFCVAAKALMSVRCIKESKP